MASSLDMEICPVSPKIPGTSKAPAHATTTQAKVTQSTKGR